MEPQPTAQPVAPANVNPAPAPAAPLQPALEPIPTTWPGAFGVYKYSKQAVKVNLGPVLITWVATIAVSFVLGLVLGSVGRIISYFFSIYFTAALTILMVAGVRNQKMSLGEALGKAAGIYLNFLLLTIMVLISITISILLLVIPVLFVLPRLTLAPYFLVDKKMGAMEAYKASWAASKTHKSKVWNIIGVGILIALLAITIIGIPFAIYFLIMYAAANAVLYGFIDQSTPAGGAAPVQPVSTPIPASPDTGTPPAPPQPPVAPSPPLVQ